MKLSSAFLLTALLSLGLFAQNAATKSRAAIEGLVIRDPDGQPVKKALIELIAENQAEAGDYTALTGLDGAFRIEGIVPGRYHLFAERTGMLDAEKERGRTDGRILTLTAGQELRDLQLRLQAAAVVRGRVTDEDGDPLPNAEVTVLRQTFVAGRKHWEQAGAERTNDLGEYRVANLAAGTFYVSVSPPPDFKTLIENAGVSASERTRNSPDKPVSTTYQTTYYPSTSDRGQAAPIQLRPGDEFPANFSLTPSPSLSIRGSVVNVPPRASATIMLQSRDFSLVLNGAEMHKDGSFIIRDVSPGNYTILASIEGSPVPMMARQSLQVESTNVDGLRLAPQPGSTLRGHLRVESSSGAARVDTDRIFLALEPLDSEPDESMLAGHESFSNLAHVAADGSFQWIDVPAGSYYVQVVGDTNANDGWFVKSVAAAGREMNDSGMTVNGGVVPIDLVISASGGIVEGIVVNPKGEPVPNAVVVAVPEAHFRTRLDRYRKTISDQGGRFSVRGIRPGDYTLFAWETVDGEAYFNPDFLKSYEGQGTALQLSEGERKDLRLQSLPETSSVE
jgi:protocatechuate 3,4-dioxygenase beta subunit